MLCHHEARWDVTWFAAISGDKLTMTPGISRHVCIWVMGPTSARNKRCLMI